MKNFLMKSSKTLRDLYLVALTIALCCELGLVGLCYYQRDQIAQLGLKADANEIAKAQIFEGPATPMGLVTVPPKAVMKGPR